MPEFNEYDVNVELTVDISVKTFLEECTSAELEEVAIWLKKHNYVDNSSYADTSNSIPQQLFDEQLDVIQANYYLLTEEEHAIIEKISKRF